MELILTKDVATVGKRGDVVRVKDGYARNFLLPQKFAISATRSNQEFVEEQRKRSLARREKERTAAQQEAKKIQNLKISIEANAGDQGKLFGSVTADDISATLKKQGYDFEKKQITVKDPIRTLGTHLISVEIYPGVKASVSIEVIQKA